MKESEKQAIEHALEVLSEHFDAVQILVEITDAGLTTGMFRGYGSWYARQGMAHEFIERDKAQEHAFQLSNKLNPPDEGEPT